MSFTPVVLFFVSPENWMSQTKETVFKLYKRHVNPQTQHASVSSGTSTFSSEVQSSSTLEAERISEVLSLRKDLFDFEANKKFIVIRNMILVKRLRTRKGKKVKHKAPANQRRGAAAINRFVSEVYKTRSRILEPIGEGENLFKFKRHRAWQIVNHVTGPRRHWFRSQAESYYGKYVFTTTFALRPCRRLRAPYNICDSIFSF